MATPIRVLIVDDEIIISLFKKNQLESYGYDVRVVATGEDR